MYVYATSTMSCLHSDGSFKSIKWCNLAAEAAIAELLQT